MAAAAIFNVVHLLIPGHHAMSGRYTQRSVAHFSSIGQTVQNNNIFTKSQMTAAAIFDLNQQRILGHPTMSRRMVRSAMPKFNLIGQTAEKL
jgi:hypothetical protein